MTATPADGVLDATALRRLWPDVLEAVKRSSRRTRALLDSAQVSQVDGDLVTVNISAAPLARMLGETSNSEVVVAALSSTFGGAWRLAVQTGPTDASVDAVAPVLADLVEPPADDDEPERPPAAAVVPAASVTAPPSTASPAPATPSASVGPGGVSTSPAPSIVVPRPPAPRPAQERDKRPAARPARGSEADPRDDTEPEDPESGAPRSDPETDALKLLESTLGARPIES